MEWDFSQSAWTAEFLSEQRKGTLLSFATTELTRHRCETMRNRGTIPVHLTVADNLTSKRKAAKAFLTEWCRAVRGDTCEEFEDAFALRPVIQTPEKKARRSTQDAVAVEPPAGDDEVASSSEGSTGADSDTD